MIGMIFFKSDRFGPTDSEAQQREIEERPDLVFARKLSDFLISELAKREYSARQTNADLKALYTENCEFVEIEHEDPYRLGFFCGNYQEGHLLHIYPESRYVWKRFRRYHAEPKRQALHDTLLYIVKAAEGISELALRA